MDEISNGLDFEMIRYSQKLIKSWSEDGTVLLTGHQFSFYNEIIDDVFIFKNNDVSLLTIDFQNLKLKLEDIYDVSIIYYINTVRDILLNIFIYNITTCFILYNSFI